MRHLLHGLQPRGRHHLDLPRRRPGRRLPPRMSAVPGHRRRPAGGGLPPDHRPPPAGRPADRCGRPRPVWGIGLSAGRRRRPRARPPGRRGLGRPGAGGGGRAPRPSTRCSEGGQALGATVLRVPARRRRRRTTGTPTSWPADEQRAGPPIAAALAPFGPPALVLCGDRSADRGTGALPAFLAHELGAAQALGLVRLELGDDGGDPAGVRRRCWPSAGWTAGGGSGSGCRCRRCARWRRPGSAAAGLAGRSPRGRGHARSRSTVAGRSEAPIRRRIGRTSAPPARSGPGPGCSPPPDGDDPRTAAAGPDRRAGGPRPARPSSGPVGRRRRRPTRSSTSWSARLPRGPPAAGPPGEGASDRLGRPRPGPRWRSPAGAGAILLVPVGSTEQHGPHLPVTTDTDIAVAIATDAAVGLRLPRPGGGPGPGLRLERRARGLRRHPVDRPGRHRAGPGRAGPVGQPRLRPHRRGLHPRRQLRAGRPGRGPARRRGHAGAGLVARPGPATSTPAAPRRR